MLLRTALMHGFSSSAGDGVYYRMLSAPVSCTTLTTTLYIFCRVCVRAIGIVGIGMRVSSLS